MLITHENEKRTEWMVFLANAVDDLSFLKLTRLTFDLDLRHFIQAGRTVTSGGYRIHPFGVQPLWLNVGWQAFKPLMAGGTVLVENKIKPLRSPVWDHFTRRERRLMDEIVQLHGSQRDEALPPLMGHGMRGGLVPIQTVQNGSNRAYEIRLGLGPMRGPHGQPSPFMTSVGRCVKTGPKDWQVTACAGDPGRLEFRSKRQMIEFLAGAFIRTALRPADL